MSYRDVEERRKQREKQRSTLLLQRKTDAIARASAANTWNGASWEFGTQKAEQEVESSNSYQGLAKIPGFKNGAANGWAKFLVDERNKGNSIPSASYLRWKVMSGVSDADEKNYSPQKNWSLQENNNFGYLYSIDPYKARGYAKIINEENQKIKETVARLQGLKADSGELEKHRVKHAAFDTGNRLGPMEAMTGSYAIRAAEGYEKWKIDKEAEQQKQNSGGFQRFREHVAKNNAAGTVEGIAAIPQLLGPDNSQYEPRSEWTFEERNRFGVLYGTNPEAAKAYAKETNDKYKQQNEEKTKEWAKRNQGVAQLSLLVTDRLGLAEVLNTELTAARDNQIPFTPQITPSQHSELVREALEEEMSQVDSVSGRIYSAIDDAVNSAYIGFLQKQGGNPLGAAISAVEDFSGGYNSALREAQRRGTSDAEALSEARGRGFVEAGGNLLTEVLNKKLPKENDVKTSIFKESVSNVVGGAVSNLSSANSKYNAMVGQYTSQGMPKEEAERLATRQIIKELGSDTLDDILGGGVYGWCISDNELTRSLRKR